MPKPSERFDADLQRLLRGEAPEDIVPADELDRRAALRTAQRVRHALGHPVAPDVRTRIWGQIRRRQEADAARRPISRRTVATALAAAAAAGVVVGIGAAVSRSAEDSPLYGLRTAIEAGQLGVAPSEAERAELVVQQFTRESTALGARRWQGAAALESTIRLLHDRGEQLVKQRSAPLARGTALGRSPGHSGLRRSLARAGGAARSRLG